MTLSKRNFVLFLLIIGYIEQVTSQCASPFLLGDVTNFCYQYQKTSLSWSDAYNQCLNNPIDGILIQSSSIDQFNALKKANIDRNTPFWLGANNFRSFLGSHWYWLDGSIVDNSVVTWCPSSTYDTAIGAYCAAYNSTLNCINNYLCSTLLPAPCVAKTSEISNQEKLISSADKTITTTGVCTNSYGGAYANWWTYSILLLNWFILLCFVLYLTYHFMINKCTVIVNVIIVILSFMLIIAFAILWGVQYQNIYLIPLVIVIVGCLASLLLLIDVLILISNRNRVQRSTACIIVTVVAIIVECILMLGLILCIAYCSLYISLASTSLDKDIIAALLAAVIAAISILLYTAILYLIGHTRQDRAQVVRPINQNPIAMTTTQTVASRPAHTSNNGVNSKVAIKKGEQIERATSPVDERILNEFYTDQPKDMHQYSLEGRQYVVFEGKSLTDIEVYRRDLTQAMLSQEPGSLRLAIGRAKASVHASNLAEEIHQAEDLARKL